MENNKASETPEKSNILTYKNIIFAIMLILVLIFISNIADIAIMFFIAFIITCAIDPVVSFLQKIYAACFSCKHCFINDFNRNTTYIYTAFNPYN